MSWTVLGIDPAPRKNAAIICNGNVQPRLAPTRLRSMITEAVREHEPVLIAWDAPLSFHRGDFYDRPIDYAAWSWLRTQEVEGAAAAPFANLPLDAYVAWRVAELFLDGGARWIGDPTNGAYVLPAGGAADNIEVEYEEALQEWERGNVLRRRP